MCGRFVLEKIDLSFGELFGIPVPECVPRYNIAPSQPVTALINDPESGGASFHILSWGLVPFWAKDKSLAMRCINARSETAHEKPAFRAALRHRRCLVPATGFYEWQREGRTRTPFFFAPAVPSEPLALAGIWEDWTDGTECLRSLSILTTAANAVMRPIHDRMPVILQPDAWLRWLDPAVQHPCEPADLLAPCNAGFLTRREFSDNTGHSSEKRRQRR